MTIIKTFTDGADTYAVNGNNSYQLDFMGGDDALRLLMGTVTARMGLGNDLVRVDGGTATIFGDEGADRFDLRGGSAAISGGADNDRFNVSGGANHMLDGGAGDDVFVAYGVAAGSQLSGGDGNDRFYGFGNGVTLAGGAGNDLYRVVSASGPDIVENAGEGSDTVQIARGLSYTLGANLENLRVIDSLGTGEDATLTGNGLRNLITGSSGRDTIDGMGGNDVLIGGSGNDTISGGDGNDQIIGGLGLDMLAGGAGSDTFVYSSLSDLSLVYGAEFISDYHPEDFIDISAIDADPNTPGDQAFVFAGYSFAHPPTVNTPGTITIGGFGGEVWILGYIDNNPGADLMINLWSPEGERALTADHIVM
jgi:Ca2+-binding RTX toxin-like protein